ncbi:MAG TPA: ATP-binding protein [Stellaceae bacterium]|nr:ATP-binding protein [Stellaceae bacterium]
MEQTQGSRDTAVETGKALPAALLYRSCDPADLRFELAGELEDAPGLIGQERAVEAIEFAIAMRKKGYNVFALGAPGTGKHSLVEGLLRGRAAAEPTPSDWCYVNNFAEPQKPVALSLPPGRAKGLAEAMKRLVEELRAALPAAFERDEYRARHEVVDQEFKHRNEAAFGELQRRAEEKGIALLRTPMGLALAPKRDGKVLPPDMFEALPEAERQRLQHEIEGIQGELEAVMQKIPQWEREHREAIRQLDRETTGAAIALMMDELRAGYCDFPEVSHYLDAVEADIKGNADDFLTPPQPPDGMPPGMPLPAALQEGLNEARFRRYQVNVIVDNGGQQGAPVVYEDNPTHQTLVGRVEHMARFGALVTDFNLLTPGALHRANGGYLILDAQRLLTGNFGWASLKRALQAGEIRLESLEQLLSMASTVSLDPAPIPLEVKIVLLGAPTIYYLLASLDDDFRELFKIAADFDDRVERSPETTLLYARLVASAMRRENLRPFDRGAVARIIERAARLAGDADRLTTGLRAIVDLMQEADALAGARAKETVGAGDVEAAIAAQFRRGDRIYRRLQEEIGRGTIRIETDGAEIGQVNGLAVMSMGGLSFGNPSRISARVRLGRGEVVDIEREVALGGPLHSKGVLILSGFLGGRFGRTRPLSLNASLVFEQSYGGVDGDSASAAELFALLSALAEAPIEQRFAVTGSVDQLGRIQAIGGVNEKIEGFFDVCRLKGLNGRQGVIIPKSNVPHLMLRPDVVAAAEAGRFAVYPIETVDEGLSLLTGLPAGAPDAEMNYPAGTLNARIAARLDAFAEKAAALARLGEPGGRS